MTSPRKLLATWFFVGYFPIASGTAGTAAAVPFYALAVVLLRAGLGEGAAMWFAYAAGTIAFIALATWIADCGERFWGRADAGQIVIDEVAGYLVTMFLLPLSWKWAAAGFVAFRFFDVVKPWPANWFDRRMPNGLGVTMDDVCAGAYACLLLHLVRRLIA